MLTLFVSTCARYLEAEDIIGCDGELACPWYVGILRAPSHSNDDSACRDLCMSGVCMFVCVCVYVGILRAHSHSHADAACRDLYVKGV